MGTEHPLRTDAARLGRPKAPWRGNWAKHRHDTPIFLENPSLTCFQYIFEPFWIHYKVFVTEQHQDVLAKPGDTTQILHLGRMGWRLLIGWTFPECHSNSHRGPDCSNESGRYRCAGVIPGLFGNNIPCSRVYVFIGEQGGLQIQSAR